MSIGQRLTARIKAMCAIHPDVNIDPEAGLELIGKKLLMSHTEALLCRTALAALVVMVNGDPPVEEGEKRFLENVIGGIAWDCGAMGGDMLGLQHVFDMPERPKVEPVANNLVRLH